MVFAPNKGNMVQDLAKRDALAVLEDASGRVLDHNMQTNEVKAALAYLRPYAVHDAAFSGFWDALLHPCQATRWQATEHAFKTIKNEVGCG